MKDNFNLYEWNKKRYLGELDIDQNDTLNVNKDDEGSSFNITRGGDDAKMGAELESDKNVVGENKEFLEDLADRLSSKVPNLRFEVSDFDDIRVYGSQQDLADFGRKYHGQQYRGYEVFAVDDDDRGEVVRIVKSDSIARNFENLNEAMDGGQLFDYFAKKGYKVTERRPDGNEAGFEGYMVSIGNEKAPQSVIFQYDKDVDQFMISRIGGYRIDQDQAAKAGMREMGMSSVVGRDSYITDGNYTPVDISVEGLKDIVDHVMTGLERERKAQADFYKARGRTSGTIDEETIKETLRFIKENNPEFTNEEIKEELKEIKELGKQLNEKLCPKGEAYRKRRMAAGEKSSAYLSGRAVKVCKGQMSGKKKKKK